MTTPDTDTLAGLLARLRGQEPIPSRSEVADAIEALAAKDKARIERLQAALRFYADISDYRAPLTGGLGKLFLDRGQVARAALEDGE